MPDLIVWSIIITVIAAGFAGAAVFAHFAMKSQKHKRLSVAALIWAGFSALMFAFLMASQGYDGLLFIFLWLGIGAPTAAGLFVGMLSGWFKRRQIALT